MIRRSAPLSVPRSGHGGFTLVELLVVMAISVILLGLIFGPIISSFNFVARAEQTADAQETARRTLQQITREVKDAVQVSVAAGDIMRLPQWQDPRWDNKQKSDGVRHLGYINAYDERVANDKTPLNLAGALIDFLPPDDTLGLNGNAGGKLSNPPVPQIIQGDQHTHEAGDGRTQAANGAHNVVIRYFVALKDPGFPHSDPGDLFSARSGAPQWANAHVSQDLLSSSDVDNTYILYRVEFDVDDPAFANWVIPDPNFRAGPRGGKAPLIVNPNFFYDGAQAANGDPYWENWRRNAVAITPLNNIDLVRFTRDADEIATGALSTVSFTPTVVRNDAASPTLNTAGSPIAYVTKHGNWTGVQNNGTLTAASYSPPAIGTFPHIVVYEPVEQTGVTDLKLVYDNWETATNSPAYPGNSRSVKWNSRLGSINFSIGNISSAGGAQDIRFKVPLNRGNGYEYDILDLAQQAGVLNIPNSLRQYVKITDESIRLTYQKTEPHEEGSTDPPEIVNQEVNFEQSLDRVPRDSAPAMPWWNAGTKGAWPRFLPPVGFYYFDTEFPSRVQLGFSLSGGGQPHPIPTERLQDGDNIQIQNPELHISFSYQTNNPNDIVKVDYGTKSLINANLGIRMFDPSTSRPIIVQLNDKIAMRNIGR